MAKSAFTKKDNFWSKTRVENNLIIKDVATAIGEDEKLVASYFSGFLMPHDASIKRICDLFDITFSKGKLEFENAHSKYKAEHGAKLKYSAKKKKPGEINNVEDVFLNLYGVVSCSEFIDIYNAVTGRAEEDIDLMGILYGKVDYKTFSKIITMIKGGI